ncbi:uncharacterized protein LOC125947756 [Dermacentor silvarum]|uniref:uncharacterized protein LOC125947756 n=1 Tax=Dermacentor silvarum TaxID=543639 RepID=UPI0021014C86|nr:uncharacterized protein LOC125947756 [Dermacentor silvarum]
MQRISTFTLGYAFALGTLVLANISIPKSKMDGWTFFNRSLDFEMTQRNYNPSAGLNATLCVTAAFKHSENGAHELTKVFFYRNISSTVWPIANVTMKFLSTVNTSRYNTVESKINRSFYGYSLPPPHWRFLYTEVNCTVVKVLSARPGRIGVSKRADSKSELREINKYCELWVAQWTQWKRGSYKQAEASANCSAAFELMCNTTTVYNVSEAKYCGPNLIKS